MIWWSFAGLGILDQVDDLDLVAAVKVLSADLLEIVKRGQ